MAPSPLVIAHRGASGYRPEHTRAAYELAFSLGADAVEPDVVATRDGVLVIRHENNIAHTTDIASHPEFAKRRTTKMIDGASQTGWFTEDFTWAELSTLRAKERLPKIRPANARYQGEPILRLVDLIRLLEGADRPIHMVAEIKHATYFASIGLPLDELFADVTQDAGFIGADRLIVESFEPSVLGQIGARGVSAKYVFLAEASGAPADQVARYGAGAKLYADYLADAGLDELAASGPGRVDGISVDKKILLAASVTAGDGSTAEGGRPAGSDLVAAAHARGLTVYCWTLRAENQFLSPPLRRGDEPSDYGDWMAEFQQLMHTGLDGVFADQPDLALAALARL